MAEKVSSKHCAIKTIKIDGFVNTVVGRIDEGKYYPESEFDGVEIKFSDFENPEDAITVWRLLIDVVNKKLIK